jgi:hypothetical protein
MNTLPFLSAIGALLFLPIRLIAGEEKTLVQFRAYNTIEHYIHQKREELIKVQSQQHDDTEKFNTYEQIFYDGFFDVLTRETDINICKSIHQIFIKPLNPRFGINTFKVMSPQSQKFHLEKGATPVLKRVNSKALVKYHTSVNLLEALDKVERYTQKNKESCRQKLFSAFTPADVTFYAHQIDEKIKHLLPQSVYDRFKKDKCNTSLQHRIAQLGEIKNKITHHTPITQETFDVMSDLEMSDVCYLNELNQLHHKNIHFVFVEDMLRQIENGTILHLSHDSAIDKDKIISCINKKIQHIYIEQHHKGIHPVAVLTNSLYELKDLFDQHDSFEQA